MQRKYQFKVAAEYSGYTIIDYLTTILPQYSKNTIKKMFHNQCVKLNESIVHSTSRVKTDNGVSISLPKAEVNAYPTVAPKLEIIFENEHFLVVNKPSGIPVIPERWSHQNLFKDGVIHHIKAKGEKASPRVVHRIDKGASGAVIVAKTAEIERNLSKLFETRKIYKEYIALVSGTPNESGRIELKIAQASKHSNRMIISEFGKSAITNYEILEHYKDFSLLKIVIETGRTHQIRLHMSSQGYPLAVDDMYGYRTFLKLSDIKDKYHPKKGKQEKPLISRLSLHAYKVSFTLPGEEPFTITAPLPKDFQVVIKKLRKFRSQGAPSNILE